MSNKAAIYLGEAGSDLLQWAAAQTSSGGFTVPPDGAQINNPAPGNWLWGYIEKPAPNRTIVRVIVDATGIEYVNHVINDAWLGWRQYATATPPQVHNLPLLDGYSLGVDGAGYSKTQEGVVSVYFSVYGAFAASSSDIGGEAFAILPEGFRPTGKIPVPVVQQDIPGPDWVKVIVHPDGSMRYYGNGSTTAIYGSVSFVTN